VRAEDGVYRVGPATFGVLLPETGAAGSGALVDRLRGGLGRDVTVGSASFPADGDDVVGLLLVAERRREGVRSTR
jgi:hypothetical protein